MKPLVVYFSLSGNTKFIAENIAAETGADILEIRTMVPYRPGSRSMNIKAFIQVFMRSAPRLRFFDRNPNSYEIIFIGSPVWVGTYSPAIRSFFKKIVLKDKKVAVFCCHSGRAGRMLYDMKERLAGSDVVGEKSFYKPLTFEKTRNAHTARGWARGIVDGGIIFPLIKDIERRDDDRAGGSCVNF